MPNRLTNLEVQFVSLVDRAAVRDPQNPTEPQKFLVWKSETARGDNPTEPIGGTMNPDELAAALAKAEKERDDALEATKKAETDRAEAVAKAEELEKAAKPAEAKPEQLDKSELTPAARAYIEKMEADQAARDERLAKAEAKAVEADELAKAEREVRVTREFIAKADEYRALPLESDKFGPVLKSASEKLSKEEYEELERVLKGADDQIANGELFKEHGRGGEAQGVETDAELTKKAEDIRKADSSLSSFQAMQQAMRENPELAARQLEGARG